jgi:flagellar protein FliS
MAGFQAQDLYLRTQVNTASPGELTLVLYNGCLKFMNLAMEAIKRKDYEAKNTNIQRATDIIQELIITLDFEYEISNDLRSLYMYIIDILRKASLYADLDRLEEAVRFTKEIRDTWAEAIKITKQTEKVGS